jgi:hypothetical protein
MYCGTIPNAYFFFSLFLRAMKTTRVLSFWGDCSWVPFPGLYVIVLCNYTHGKISYHVCIPSFFPGIPYFCVVLGFKIVFSAKKNSQHIPHARLSIRPSYPTCNSEHPGSYSSYTAVSVPFLDAWDIKG